MEFYEKIAELVQKYAPQYGIKVYSPIIAQAILESGNGKSELAVGANNYFGLKYKSDISNGYYIKVGSEQNADGSYTSSVMKWCKFPSMDAGVEGYFKFTNVSRYSNLKGVTDPRTYLENIKADGYATSLKYVDNLMNVINSYNLTRFDTVTNGETKMRINVHAGHNPDGKVACGAIGNIKESTEARKVKELVIDKLRSQGHTVFDCTVNDGKSQSDVLQKIVAKCNQNVVDLDISIHFNAGANDAKGNGKTTGTEVFVYSATSKAKDTATRICNSIADLGFANRGVKVNTGLYVLKHTNSPAMLIECCFVDDLDDTKRYTAESMATAIVKGITGNTVLGTIESDKLYRVQVGAYKQKKNAEIMLDTLKAHGFEAFIVES